MTLSPFEAEHREFGRGPFGYRPRDVDHFVDEVQRSLRALWQERGDAREENERLKERLARFEQIEEQLKNTLLLAQDSAEKAHDQARRESDLVMREAGQKSRDIVNAAHEEKQKLEMVLRDLHSAEQEARQRLRTMSTAILSHLDDTEALVAESTGNFRAVVQAQPEASELRGSTVETVYDIAERAVLAADAAEAEATRVRLDADAAAAAVERIEAGATVVVPAVQMQPLQAHAPDADPELDAATNQAADLGTGIATSSEADAFFDAPPSFDTLEAPPRAGMFEH